MVASVASVSADGPRPPTGRRDPLLVVLAAAIAATGVARDVSRSALAQAPSVEITVIDLSDDWAPAIFAEAPDLGVIGAQPYRREYLELADERSAAGDRDLELFGIFPTFRVLRGRWLDDARHACHDAIDPAALAELTRDPPRADESSRDRQRRSRREAMFLLRRLGDEAERRGLFSIEALASDEELGPRLDRFHTLARRIAAPEALQARLRCDGLLEPGRYEVGVIDPPTVAALRAWQRRHMVISNGRLDTTTLDLLRSSSLELVFRATLRALRERVADTAGLVEDGSASTSGAVFGRLLDPPELRATEALGPLPNGAPDLVSAATEAAARTLGWIDPAATRASFASQPEESWRRRTVSVALPRRPAWHSASMDLRAEIDRGDVWYAFPYTLVGVTRRSPVRRRPTLTMSVMHEGRAIPLVRFSTTIGGWKDERLPNERIGLRYKGSPMGARVWRDLIASPAWLPPATTPDEELVRRAPEGEWEANVEIARPGYRSAYGLVMLVHHAVVPPLDAEGEDDARRWIDEGVRTHGSVAYGSVLNGTSHGCHRLFNHLAVRLAGFLLRHRPHVRRGALPTRFVRMLHHRGRAIDLTVDNRGYLYELTPPVPVTVLEGTIVGSVREPLRGLRPLPSQLARRATLRDEIADQPD